MPVITQEKAAAPERRRRTRRAPWLLLAAPALFGMGLLAIIAMRPLPIGPYFLFSLLTPAPGVGLNANIHALAGNQRPFPTQDGWYEIRNGGAVLELNLLEGNYLIGWFHGAHARK